MKPKYFTYAAFGLIILCISICFSFCRQPPKKDNTTIIKFLADFNKQLVAHNKKALPAFFDVIKGKETVERIVSILLGGSADDEDKEQLFSVLLDINNSDISNTDSTNSVVTMNVDFGRNNFETGHSQLSFNIRKTSNGKFKITEIVPGDFISDYYKYRELVIAKSLKDEDIYSPQTLRAFALAKQITTKYDSVIWFTHYTNKPFFYVVNGKWDFFGRFEGRPDTTISYKMGLVDENQQVIIPAEYDLIHTIDGTVKGLFEVEKQHKRGFYSVDGKNVLPVDYDQIFPVVDGDNLAVLRKGNDYFRLKNNYEVVADPDIKIADVLAQTPVFHKTFKLSGDKTPIITEFNSRDQPQIVIIPPSYLVDLDLMPTVQQFINPLRKHQMNYEDGSKKYEVTFDQDAADGNWVSSAFYSIRDYFLGGRMEFYDNKDVILVDKKSNRVYGANINLDYSPDGGGSLQGECDVNDLKLINDSLYEVKSAAVLYVNLYNGNDVIDGGPAYHYMQIKNDKLIELPNNRMFGFTKYIKMDDSYLTACYKLNDGHKRKTIQQLGIDAFKYMKNEIYADYKYKFKDKKWEEVFKDSMGNYYDKDDKFNESVEDSLTMIDRYNISFIDQKIKELNGQNKLLTAK